MPRYRDRRHAGQELAKHAEDLAGCGGLLLLALPRGGVPVAYELALALHLPMDLYVVRKLGVPGQAELAMGAIASGGIRVLNRDVIASLGISHAALEAVIAMERAELQRRESLYRRERGRLDLRGRHAVLIDDGLATGATMRAAVSAARAAGATRVTVAVPTAPADTCALVATIADQMICPVTPMPFFAVGASYVCFDQVTDVEVAEYLQLAEEAGLLFSAS